MAASQYKLTAEVGTQSIWDPAAIGQLERWASRNPPCYPAIMKVSEILRMLESNGWRLVATRGSHRQFKHPSKAGRVTIPGKPSAILHPVR